VEISTLVIFFVCFSFRDNVFSCWFFMFNFYYLLCGENLTNISIFFFFFSVSFLCSFVLLLCLFYYYLLCGGNRNICIFCFVLVCFSHVSVVMLFSYFSFSLLLSLYLLSAVKIVNISDLKPDILKRVESEIYILRFVSHENIVEYLGYERSKTELKIFMVKR
jgi:hypothetical protein